MRINIAIDGPSAAGKSTIASLLCQKLGYVHLDTGAMYRCVALAAVQNNISFDDEASLAEMLDHTQIKLSPDGKVFLNDVEVTDEIRTDTISMGASSVSRHIAVRSRLVALQQEMAQSLGFVMDGRDIGTVVLKDAALKIYLTASIEARAMRRYLDNQNRGLPADLKQLEDEIAQRDYQDMHREVSPLQKAEDAIEIDTSNMSIDEVVNAIMALVEPLTKE